MKLDSNQKKQITNFLTNLVKDFSLKIPDDNSIFGGSTNITHAMIKNLLNSTNFATYNSISKGTYPSLVGSSGIAKASPPKEETKFEKMMKVFKKSKKNPPDEHDSLW